jgi:hypothetical protein
MFTQATQATANSRCISEHDPKDPYSEQGYTGIARLLNIARDAIKAANEFAKTLPPSPSNGCRKRFALYEEDDFEEYVSRHCFAVVDEQQRLKRIRSEKFKEDVKRRGGFTPFHKSVEEEEGEVEPNDEEYNAQYIPPFSPIQFTEGRSYTPPPATQSEWRYSPHDPDA